MKQNYIMLTPVKNEIHFIKQTVLSVVNQTVTPALWVIVDGGSTDGTFEFLTEFSKHHDWIKVYKQSRVINQTCVEYSRDTHTHMNVSIAAKQAYDYAFIHCRDNKINFDYIWTIDADQTLEPEVCYGVIKRMSIEPAVGVASGQVYDPGMIPDTYPSGELPNKRVYRADAIVQIGGFPITKYSYDSVILAKIRLVGWGVITYPEFSIYNLRSDSGIERNSWKSSIIFGKARYYLGYSIPLLLIGCGYLVTRFKISKSIGIFIGFTSSLIHHDEIINDISVWNHFHNGRLKEILK